jgi:hypothetical protein
MRSRGPLYYSEGGQGILSSVNAETPPGRDGNKVVVPTALQKMVEAFLAVVGAGSSLVEVYRKLAAPLAAL